MHCKQFAAALLFCFGLSTVSTAAPALKALIVDGQNNHHWQATTPLIKKALEESTLFSVDVATAPAQHADKSDFRPKFADYNVVVLNYNGGDWPADTQKDLVSYVAGGGGLVSVHAADNSFPHWKEYNEMIGLGGWGGRNEKDGPYVYWKDGQFVHDTKKGPGGAHGAQFPFLLETRNAEHPIMKGLPEKFRHAPDELYSLLRGPAKNLTVLATAYGDPKYGGTGRNEPILMVIDYGKGRVFHTTMGHDAPQCRSVAFIVTLQRGAEWAATGKVTQAVPSDFPGEEKPALRECSAPDAPATEAGFESMFDGKTLDGWDGDPDHWSVEDGCIVGQTSKEKPAKYNTFLIWRKAKPGDFEIKAEFRMPNDAFANSGIQIRSWEGPKKWQVSGYQSDMDWEDHYTGIIYGEGYAGRGIVAERGKAVTFDKDGNKSAKQFAKNEDIAKAIKHREWNEYDIICEGNHIKQSINGVLTCECTDDDVKNAKADGLIALQIHAGPPMKVLFRNLRIAIKKPVEKELKQCSTDAAKKKIVFIAGSPSHGYAQHEHNAGCILLAKALNENVPQVEAVVSHGWPKDPAVLADAASIVIYADGGPGHPMLKHIDEMKKLMAKGVGLACIHYAVEVPKGPAGDMLAQWTGGYFETFWSVNPEWKAEYKALPDHPVARGVKPFSIQDEWYFHMRFVDGMDGVTPILTAIPPDEVHRKGNDAHGANASVFARKGQPEHMCWVRQRPDGGRGFGLTGGHWHWNWGNDNFRKVALNGIVWTAGLEVPADGVPSKTPGLEELQANQDKPVPGNWNKEQVEKLLAGFGK